MILLGVEDDGSISGVQRPNLEEWVMDAVFADKVHPMMIPFYKEVTMADGRRVAVISFPSGASKPYVLRFRGREEIYIRVGGTSRRATREQQARLFANGGILHAETLPVAGASLRSLDRRHNHAEPIFETTADYLKTTLPRGPGNEPVSRDARRWNL